jgi:hypothetical protein
MPIFFSDYCEYMWYPCAFVVFLMFFFLMSCVVLCNCIEGKQPPEDGCMKPKHVVEEEEENK